MVPWIGGKYISTPEKLFLPTFEDLYNPCVPDLLSASALECNVYEKQNKTKKPWSV